MEITGINANDPIFGVGSSSAAQELDKDAFMKLFVAQLENQDPLEPVANGEFIAQLATFSSLEQLENLNTSLVTMTLLQQSNALLSQLTEGSALIGQRVSWADPTTGLSGEGIVESVKLIDGLAWLTVGGTDIPLVDIIEVMGSDETDDAGDPGDTDDSGDS